ncbi:unnamed protein product [Zymoseptoria tritici ST99CH_3D1]|nr:unnamed protein product [Zymoseptoria tritici ST99CH_3D1]
MHHQKHTPPAPTLQHQPHTPSVTLQHIPGPPPPPPPPPLPLPPRRQRGDASCASCTGITAFLFIFLSILLALLIPPPPSTHNYRPSIDILLTATNYTSFALEHLTETATIKANFYLMAWKMMEVAAETVARPLKHCQGTVDVER